ncbi:MAG: PilZ domain-containing protein [Oligoflexia bacterium]|nr:PilZ domain-containing protein [Oligoflexia bacterium]
MNNLKMFFRKLFKKDIQLSDFIEINSRVSIKHKKLKGNLVYSIHRVEANEFIYVNTTNELINHADSIINECITFFVSKGDYVYIVTGVICEIAKEADGDMKIRKETIERIANRRSNPRYNVNYQGLLKTLDKNIEIPFVTQNISIGGVEIRTPKINIDISIDTEVNITISIPNNKQIIFQAKILRFEIDDISNNITYALQITEIDRRNYDSLNEFITDLEKEFNWKIWNLLDN